MIAEIIFALEAKKADLAKVTIERATSESFDVSKGRYAGIDDAINIIKGMVADKGRADGDL